MLFIMSSQAPEVSLPQPLTVMKGWASPSRGQGSYHGCLPSFDTPSKQAPSGKKVADVLEHLVVARLAVTSLTVSFFAFLLSFFFAALLRAAALAISRSA